MKIKKTKHGYVGMLRVGARCCMTSGKTSGEVINKLFKLMEG